MKRMEINVRKRKILSIAACAVICAASLSGCGSGNKKGDGSGHMYRAALPYNPKSLDPQYATDPSSATVIKNLYSGLVMKDEKGGISCCNAKDYSVSADGCVYTFHLREDNYWFFDENNDDIIDDDEYFPVTAKDYVFALRRILDPDMHSPFANEFMCLKDSRLARDNAHSMEALGVVAKDDYTLEISLEYPCAEFLSLLATPAAYPCNEEFFLSTKGRYGLDDRSVMSNGPFYVRQWYFDPYGSANILYMRKNEVNENEVYDIYPSFVSFSIEKNESAVKQCFKDDTAECFSSLKVGGYNPKKYNISGYKAITLGLVFNPADKLYSNENLRRAVALAADREALKGETSSDIQPAYGIIPPAVDIVGRSYRELSSEKQFDIYDTRAAADALARAKEELKVKSVESVKIIVDSSTVDSRYLHVLSQHWQDSLGIYIGIEDLTSKEFNERIESGNYSIALYPVKGDFNSGLAVLDKFRNEECLKKAAGEGFNTENVLKSSSVTELVNNYTAYEKALLERFGFVPLFYKSSYLVAKEDNEDIIYDPFTGSIDYRIAKNYS
ncbi:oligopeptide transport system substrate-binding protein [Ruminococcus flavefaciens]|uniref:Oligopeptide transport system substrate-binding protein n=1 Tax=Ruminococcus flavefaciens TaxID=1265 RepID=A0A1M7MA74_RUMFL|nr:oligopeptide transport system substrate-binding protein [Ruminococcus flavefaciens]